MLKTVIHPNNGIERKKRGFKYEYLRQYKVNSVSIRYKRYLYDIYDILYASDHAKTMCLQMQCKGTSMAYHGKG